MVKLAMDMNEQPNDEVNEQPDEFTNPRQQASNPEQILQVVYERGGDGSFVGVGASLLEATSDEQIDYQNQDEAMGARGDAQRLDEMQYEPTPMMPMSSSIHQQMMMSPMSLLDSIPEQPTGQVGTNSAASSADLHGAYSNLNQHEQIPQDQYEVNGEGQRLNTIESELQSGDYGLSNLSPSVSANSNDVNIPIYSTVNKQQQKSALIDSNRDGEDQGQLILLDGELGANDDMDQDERSQQSENIYENNQQQLGPMGQLLTDEPDHQGQQQQVDDVGGVRTNVNFQDELQNDGDLEFHSKRELDGSTSQDVDFTDISGHVMPRRGERGAVESGSFRNNFKKKISSSVSATDNDLTLHRRKFLEQQDSTTLDGDGSSNSAGNTLKRNQLVSFSNHDHGSGSRSSGSRQHGSRVSVDIRQLPSYITNKRASIVDVAKGAMSSLLQFAAGGGSGSNSGSQKRDSTSSRSPSMGSRSGSSSSSSSDEEPIFEEPIAPTLSLGQRVAWVSGDGPEFGTVGWIGQLPEVDNDWVVGVIFDNMIGDCDGQFKGTRYFYARENYAMFLPLSTLTKTDNYIGRPETGTMLSRMSVQLKPGQLISIQRSSIRLQHCFLNAPHQRVGHDVRAVSNRLHCQCHTCGPCAHLTKQGQRLHGAQPHFRSQHTHHDRKKNSLAQAAIELLAHHHHHHFHEEEEPNDNEDHQFGENSAHACNYVRYSCCQQSGVPGHDFMADCEMVRPELLDNLIHAPKAPHRRLARKQRRVRAQLNQFESKHQEISYNNTNTNTNGRATLLERQQTNAIPFNQVQPALTGTINDATIKSWKTTTTTMTTTTTTNTNHDQTTSNYEDALSNCSSCSPSSARSSSASSSGSSSGSGSGESGNSSARANDRGHNRHYPPPSNNNQHANTHSLGYRTELTNYRQDNNFYNSMDSHISLLDQRRFIQQRDSLIPIRSTSNISYRSNSSLYNSSTRSSMGSTMKRCFNWCSFWSRSNNNNNNNKRESNRTTSGARSSKSSRRKKSSSSSARNRLIEYRRRQSTFVPSTLAKPHDDFASHGIILDGIEETAGPGSSLAYGQDFGIGALMSQDNYHNEQIPPSSMNFQSPSSNGGLINLTDSYNGSSYNGPSSYDRNDLPSQGAQTHVGAISIQGNETSSKDAPPQQVSNFSDNSPDNKAAPSPGSERDSYRMMKCSPGADNDNNNSCSCCQNSTNSSRDIKKNPSLSEEGDLGFFDTLTYNTSSSNDTLKHIVDSYINDEVSPPEPVPLEYNFSPEISLAHNDYDDDDRQNNEQSVNDNHIDYEISSPTASVDVDLFVEADNQVPPDCSSWQDGDHDNLDNFNESNEIMQQLFENLSILNQQQENKQNSKNDDEERTG